jgi:hypothetical protein
MFKRSSLFTAAALVSLCASASAQSDSLSAAEALRSDCAAVNPVKQAAPAQGANEYSFVYYKGELRGELSAGKALDCSESQYAVYLNKADPARVMAAHPTAAGKPAKSK